jgi:hypothetical protein
VRRGVHSRSKHLSESTRSRNARYAARSAISDAVFRVRADCLAGYAQISSRKIKLSERAEPRIEIVDSAGVALVNAYALWKVLTLDEAGPTIWNVGFAKNDETFGGFG